MRIPPEMIFQLMLNTIKGKTASRPDGKGQERMYLDVSHTVNVTRGT